MHGAGGVIGFVLVGKSTTSHSTESICGTDFDDALGLALCQDDILRLDPSYGRGKLVGEEFDEKSVGKFLLDFRMHDGGGKECVEVEKAGLEEGWHGR